MSEGSSKKIKYCKANWRVIVMGVGTLCDSLVFRAMVLTELVYGSQFLIAMHLHASRSSWRDR